MRHENIEKNIGLMTILTLIVVSVGGLVEIVPLFYIDDTVEEVESVRPFTPLEQRGRDIYVKEGCYLCHSQQVRPFRDEEIRYGHYSLAAESKYSHPFQWGSKRTGPDLARVGGKYSNEWQVQHLIAPRSVVPESVMPNYPHLMEELDYSQLQARMRALKAVGVPYTEEGEDELYQKNVERWGEDVAERLHIPNAEESLKAEAEEGNFDGDPSKLTEMDAIVAYLQVLGTMVDFDEYSEPEQGRSRGF
ncbi:peptidase S41 [Thiohalorhabdus denitrificans]|uniref:Cytochrome c oxidase cbb3-type subunit 2 n=1 Tax=Thiohalorhabdus denitrificans TaxID=381306 RepID=A0A0N8PNF8_9GAMM|nr:cytochrome-c oxidase, cbb3-type subunit II [Thiohalorhabdus denitrificans]KPV41405.1 peptidase S41 [Thiohalorhabdus denitrificans]SCY26210.1 cytochrome c oxidase cbb3-type subunit 2 [Thiohalorhabdus denitrificans]